MVRQYEIQAHLQTIIEVSVKFLLPLQKTWCKPSKSLWIDLIGNNVYNFNNNFVDNDVDNVVLADLLEEWFWCQM